MNVLIIASTGLLYTVEDTDMWNPADLKRRALWIHDNFIVESTLEIGPRSSLTCSCISKFQYFKYELFSHLQSEK